MNIFGLLNTSTDYSSFIVDQACTTVTYMWYAPY